jgi:hypothetical protein
MSDVRIYRYYYNRNKYYGEGMNEKHVRLGIEYKLGLEPGTLNAGSTKVGLAERKRVTSNRTTLNYFKSSTNLKGKRIIDSTIDQIKDMSGIRNDDIIKKNLSKCLNIPKDLIDEKYDEDLKMRDWAKLSMDKILVKTHKFQKEERVEGSLTSEGMSFTKSNALVGAISRVDQIRDLVKKLVSLDYNIIFDHLDLDDMYSRKLSSYNKSIKLVDDHKASVAQRKKAEELIRTLPKEISDLKQQIIMRDSSYHNIGYYVNWNDNYPHKTFEEFLQELDTIYDKLVIKVSSYGYNYIPIEEGKEITIEEYLHSYQLVRSQNNSYVKIKKDEE